jgi:hypothetical protein
MAEEKMRLWEVEVTVRVMVLAATRDEAERFAERDEDSCVSDSLRDAGSASAHEPKVLDTDLPIRLRSPHPRRVSGSL